MTNDTTMETTVNNQRNRHGVKNAIDCYRTINGIKYIQWADRGTRDECQQIIDTYETQTPQEHFIIRKISDGYRCYKSID